MGLTQRKNSPPLFAKMGVRCRALLKNLENAWRQILEQKKRLGLEKDMEKSSILSVEARQVRARPTKISLLGLGFCNLPCGRI